MTFIIVLISLIIERFFDWSHLRHWEWLVRYQQWMNNRFAHWSVYLATLVAVLPLLIAVGVVNHLLSGVLFGLLTLLFGVFILVYCFGPENFWAQIYSCIAILQKDDSEAAMKEIGALFRIKPTRKSQAFHLTLIRTLFVESHRRVFAVLFWFVILGPIGAVLYRFIAINSEQPGPGAFTRRQMLRIIDWLPVRVYTFIFALGGHFTEVFPHWRRRVISGLGVNRTLLTHCGVAALDVVKDGHIPEDGSVEQKTIALLDRVYVMALVILAIVVLII